MRPARPANGAEVTAAPAAPAGPAPETARPRWRQVPAGLLAAAAVCLCFLCLCLGLAAPTRNLPGAIDEALVFGCPAECGTAGGGGGGDPVPDVDADWGGSAAPCSVWGRSRRHRVLWRLLRRATGSDEGLCGLCWSYRRRRSHVGVGGLLLDAAWWRRCELRAVDVTVLSRPGALARRPTREGRRDSPAAADGDPSGGAASAPPPGVFGPRDVLRVGVAADRPDCAAERGGAAPPPPAVEVADLRMQWRSWRYPVVDLHVTGIRVNLVLGTAHPRGGTKGMRLPTVLFGDTPGEEVIAMLPPPPQAEGTYPRIGAINITNVTISLHTMSGPTGASVQGECVDAERQHRGATHVAKVVVPDESFNSLLLATSVPEGTDKYHFNSILETALTSAVRNHVFQEEKLREGINHLIEVAELTKNVTAEKLRDGGDALDSFVSDGRAMLRRLRRDLGGANERLGGALIAFVSDGQVALRRLRLDLERTNERLGDVLDTLITDGHVAFDHLWQNLKHDWQKRNERLQESFKSLEKGWEKFLGSIEAEQHHLEKYLDGLVVGLEEFRRHTEDWKDNFTKVLEEWKGGWDDFQKMWTKEVSLSFKSFLADSKRDWEKLHSAMKSNPESQHFLNILSKSGFSKKWPRSQGDF